VSPPFQVIVSTLSSHCLYSVESLCLFCQVIVSILSSVRSLCLLCQVIFLSFFNNPFRHWGLACQLGQISSWALGYIIGHDSYVYPTFRSIYLSIHHILSIYLHAYLHTSTHSQTYCIYLLLFHISSFSHDHLYTHTYLTRSTSVM